MDMTIAIAALENLKGFENISRESVSTGCGCESATRERSFGRHGGSLDSQIVARDARQGRILNHMELEQN